MSWKLDQMVCARGQKKRSEISYEGACIARIRTAEFRDEGRATIDGIPAGVDDALPQRVPPHSSPPSHGPPTPPSPVTSPLCRHYLPHVYISHTIIYVGRGKCRFRKPAHPNPLQCLENELSRNRLHFLL